MAGADKAMLYGLPPVGAILIGVMSGTGGSVLADLAVGVPPALFRPGRLRGLAAAAGTVCSWWAHTTRMPGWRGSWPVW